MNLLVIFQLFFYFKTFSAKATPKAVLLFTFNIGISGF